MLLILILGAPLNHAGRNSTGIWGVNRQGCRFSRPAPWRARGGGPPNQCRITGTPSLGEVPSGGARAFCSLLRFSKVSRCKSGTYSGRYLNNGYVPRTKTNILGCQAATGASSLVCCATASHRRCGGDSHRLTLFQFRFLGTQRPIHPTPTQPGERLHSPPESRSKSHSASALP